MNELNKTMMEVQEQEVKKKRQSLRTEFTLHYITMR
jgi:hypothetical protein